MNVIAFSLLFFGGIQPSPLHTSGRNPNIPERDGGTISSLLSSQKGNHSAPIPFNCSSYSSLLLALIPTGSRETPSDVCIADEEAPLRAPLR